jgi:hypothetical protein
MAGNCNTMNAKVGMNNESERPIMQTERLCIRIIRKTKAV